MKYCFAFIHLPMPPYPQDAFLPLGTTYHGHAFALLVFVRGLALDHLDELIFY